jgi:hypothetical protein
MPFGGNDPHGNDRDGWFGNRICSPVYGGFTRLEDFKRISAAARLKRPAHGEMLYLEGETVEHILLLISGSVKNYAAGTERDGSHPHAECLMRLACGRRYTTAQAIRECRTRIWDVGHDLVGRLPVLRQNIPRLICGHPQELEKRFRQLAMEGVAPRVARQLIRLQEPARPRREWWKSIFHPQAWLLSAWEAHGLVTCCRESVMIHDVRALRAIFKEN